MNNHIEIRNLKLFSKSVRKNTVMIFPRSYFYNIESLLSLKQTEQLVRKYIEPGDNDQFIITEDNYSLLCCEIKKFIYNRSLSMLASYNTLECSWDDKSNEMIFWNSESKDTFNIIK